MNELVPVSMGGKVSARFAGMKVDNDMSSGIQAGFGMIGYKGKVWSIRHRGDEKNLMREDGDGPRNSIEVVVLKASSVVAKIFYQGGYVDGSTTPPDCFSTNGITPDQSSTHKQCATCALCEQNKWGSRITEGGKKGKACSDSKRLAVVPLADIPNETFGGPMLLRVPAASLADLASFGDKMAGWGYPYFGIGVRISFDTTTAYPKFVFKEIRQLSDEEADVVIRMREEPAVARILAEGSENVVVPMNEPAPGPAFEVAKPVASVATVTPVLVVNNPAANGTAVDYNLHIVTPKVTAGGFGVTAPAGAAPTPTTNGQTVPVSSSPATQATSFEDDLDAQLDKLMPA